MATDEHMTRHGQHMQRVYAVQRRSAYERVLAKIAWYEAWRRDAEMSRAPALNNEQQRQLAYLRELRDSLRQEMIQAGQMRYARGSAGHEILPTYHLLRSRCPGHKSGSTTFRHCMAHP